MEWVVAHGCRATGGSGSGAPGVVADMLAEVVSDSKRVVVRLGLTASCAKRCARGDPTRCERGDCGRDPDEDSRLSRVGDRSQYLVSTNIPGCWVCTWVVGAAGRAAFPCSSSSSSSSGGGGGGGGSIRQPHSSRQTNSRSQPEPKTPFFDGQKSTHARAHAHNTRTHKHTDSAWTLRQTRRGTYHVRPSLLQTPLGRVSV